MLKRGYKLIFSVVFITTLFLVCSVSAFAESVSIAGLIDAALGASGIAGESYNISSQAFDDLNYQSTGLDAESWYEPFSEYSIYYENNTDTIDGVSYDTIKITYPLSDFAREQGIYYAEDNSITTPYDLNEISGAVVANSPFVFPYQSSSTVWLTGSLGNVVKAANTSFPFFASDGSSGTLTVGNGLRMDFTGTYGTGVPFSGNNSNVSQGTPIHFVAVYNSSTQSYYFAISLDSNPSGFRCAVSPTVYIGSDPVSFDIEYYNDEVTITRARPDTAISVKVPHSSNTASVPDGYSNSTTFKDILGQLTSSVVDGSVRDRTWDSSPLPPQPTPTPVPTDVPLGEVPYPDFLDTFGQSIYSKLDSIRNVADTIGQRIESILEDVETAIDTAGQSIEGAIDSAVGTIGGILTDIKNGILSIPQYLTQILEAVITHPLDMFDAFLDAFMEHSGIGGLLDELKERLGIWHYVVEWLQCIGGVFRFFFGIMSSVAYCMVVPIYALVAGSICLAIYKRFGR